MLPWTSIIFKLKIGPSLALINLLNVSFFCITLTRDEQLTSELFKLSDCYYSGTKILFFLCMIPTSDR